MCDSTQGSLCRSFMKMHQCVWIQWPFFQNLNQRSLVPRWPLTSCLLKSQVWLYPRITVSKSHENISMHVDTVINFAKYHTHIYYIHRDIHTKYRMSDHIVSFWTRSGETKMSFLTGNTLSSHFCLLVPGHHYHFPFLNPLSVILIYLQHKLLLSF